MNLLKKQLATFEALRRLGFDSCDIFVSYNHGNVLTVLMTQSKRFNIEFPDSEVPTSEDEYVLQYKKMAERWNSEMSETERDQIYRTVYTADSLAAVAVALVAKGISIPNLPVSKDVRELAKQMYDKRRAN